MAEPAADSRFAGGGYDGGVRRRHFLLPSLIVSGSLAVGCQPQSESSGHVSLGTTPIPASEVEQRGIAGRLGQPLGRVIRVRGTIVAADRNAKLASSELYLLADWVEGSALRTPILVALSETPKPNLKPGERISCIGFETAKFEGKPFDPADLLQDHGSTLGYAFRTEFVINKIEH